MIPDAGDRRDVHGTQVIRHDSNAHAVQDLAGQHGVLRLRTPCQHERQSESPNPANESFHHVALPSSWSHRLRGVIASWSHRRATSPVCRTGDGDSLEAG